MDHFLDSRVSKQCVSHSLGLQVIKTFLFSCRDGQQLRALLLQRIGVCVPAHMVAPDHLFFMSSRAFDALFLPLWAHVWYTYIHAGRALMQFFFQKNQWRGWGRLTVGRVSASVQHKSACHTGIFGLNILCLVGWLVDFFLFETRFS